MWNKNSIHIIEQNLEGRDQMSASKGIAPQIRPFVENIEEMDRQRIRKANGISFALGVVFMVIFYFLVANGQVKLTGPYTPMFLMLFYQRLEYVLRYQALAVSPLAINAFIVFVRHLVSPKTEETEDEWADRLNKPLKDSILQFLMSLTLQLALTANLNAEQVMLFCPLIAVLFFFGSLAYLATYPNYHFFGTALTFVPSFVGILFNAYGAIRFIFL